MISLLHIKNIGIIDDLEIELNKGLNILTGETGAGKTLIIESLKFLSGFRFSKEMIRKGKDFSSVEASIILDGYDDNVIISREINNTGKNICKIDGRLVTVNELKEFMKNVIDIHSQNDTLTVLETDQHITLLDSYAESEMYGIKIEYGKLYSKYQKTKKELKLNYGDEMERQRKLDLLNYQLNEIDNAELKEDEEESLEERRKVILASEKISDSINEAKNEIDNGSIECLNNAIRAIEKIEQYNSEYSDFLQRLKSSYYEIQEVSRDLNNQAVDFNEEELYDIENRLDLIKSLKRKYGNNINQILEYRDQVEKEIFDINNMDKYRENLKNNLKEFISQMKVLTTKMTQRREKYAKELSARITKELTELEMMNAEFFVQVKEIENNQFNINGLDEVKFMISTNKGEEAKELTKVASGGEMSRVMLAIKTVLADVDKTPIMIFDEIDTGISGVAANSTGDKMKKISKTHQVICITHLASIAAKGDYNYYIYKNTLNDNTQTHISKLNEEEIIKEIARIANGEITQISIENAKEMRKLSKNIA